MLWIDGAWKIVLLVFFVDVVIGPLLTLFVTRKPKKLPALVFDLTVIAVVQTAALFYGVTQLLNQRIEALVYLNEFFHVVSHVDILEGYQDNKNLKYYDKLAIGALTHDDFKGMVKAEIELAMNNPSQFYSLDEQLVSAKSVDADLIPVSVQNNYGQGFIFKTLVGKTRNGLVVLNTNRDIVDIVLAKEK